MIAPPWKDEADRQSSSWLDRDDRPPEMDSPDGAGLDQQPAQHYLADVLLVDALLASMSDGAVDEQAARIGRVLDAIHDSTPALWRPARLAYWSSLAALAACLLIAVALSWTQFGQHTMAKELLSAVHKVSLEVTDRVYSIRRVVSTSADLPLPQGRLYLRGREGFVITWSDVVLGRNGDEFWLVAPDGHVTLSGNFDWIDAGSTRDEVGLRVVQELSLQSRHIPLMQLASVAELMGHDYDVKWSRGQLEGRRVDLLVGYRQTAASELPETIQLWSDVDSQVIQRAELGWGRDNAIVLELEPAEPIAADWYSYQAHGDAHRSVRRIPSGP